MQEFEDGFWQIIHDAFPVVGNRIYLNNISVSDLLYLREWIIKEPQEKITCRPIAKYGTEEALIQYKMMLKSNAAFIFGVYEMDSDALIGKVTIGDYNSRNRSAEIGYFTIPKFRGFGYTKESLNLIHKFIFSFTDMNKIVAQTASFNESSIMLLKSLGYRFDGMLREHHELNGKLYDDYIYSILKKDFIFFQ